MRKRWLILATVLVAMLTIYFSGLWEIIADVEGLRRLLIESGPWGGLLYVVLVTVLEAFGAPGFVFIFTAALVWPPAQASMLALTGALGAAVLGFLVARYFMRDWIEPRLPTRMRGWDQRLATHGFSTVLALRVVFYCAPWTNWLFGVSQVRFVPFLLATILTYIPWTVFLVYSGRAGFEWAIEQSYEVWLGLLAVAVSYAIIRWIRGRSIARREKAAAELLDLAQID